MRAVLALTLLLGAVACDGPGGVDAGGDTPGRDAAGAMPTVELGTGTSSFVPIPETGAELELVMGPQGGFHVFVTARIEDLDVEDMLIRYSAHDTTTGELVGHEATYVTDSTRLARDGAGWVRAGDFVILHDSSPDTIRGRVLEISVHVEEASGAPSADDSRVVTIVDEVGG